MRLSVLTTPLRALFLCTCLMAQNPGDPANWAAWNKLAQFQLKQGRPKDAGASFDRIGTHWVPFVWDKSAFEKARAQAAS
jgi:hypothetical protein